jgi:erythromycin esterase-like protein
MDGNSVDPDCLSFLDDLLAGKRIVYLGESDHWVNQKYDYRLMLIRHLFDKGWRRIGMEMDYCDGKRIDRYLETGDPSHLKRVALYGYKGGWREDRDDIPDGFPGLNNQEFRKAFLFQEHKFLGELRSLNESLGSRSKRLSWFGFDIGILPCVGYEDALEILAEYSHESVIQDLAERIQRVEGESRTEEIRRLEKLLGFIEIKSQSINRILGSRQAGSLLRTLQHQVDYLYFAEAANMGPRTMEWFHGLVRREQRMARLMDEILADLPPGEKIILMGHNLHMSKNSEEIVLGPIGSAAPNLWTSIGTYVERKYPGDVYSVWMMYDHGRHGTILSPEGVGIVESNPACVEHLLARVGGLFLLPLGSGEDGESFLQEKQHFLQNGSIASGVIAEQADALFFVREVTELEGE